MKLLEKPVNQNIGWVERYRPYLQLAFNIILLFAVNDLLVTIWRSMTGH